MDELQIKHAISQIEIYSAQLREHLETSSNYPSVIAELETELSEANDEYIHLESQIDSMRHEMNGAKKILNELLYGSSGTQLDHDKLKDAIALL